MSEEELSNLDMPINDASPGVYRSLPREAFAKVAYAGYRTCICISLGLSNALSSSVFQLTSCAIGAHPGHPCIAFRRRHRSLFYARGYLS